MADGSCRTLGRSRAARLGNQPWPLFFVVLPERAERSLHHSVVPPQLSVSGLCNDHRARVVNQLDGMADAVNVRYGTT